MSPTNIFFTVTSALCIPLVCMPLPCHLQAWNTGTCLFMMWTALALFIYCTNSIIWNHDAIVRVPVWCDITTKLIVGWGVGIPASGLCIMRRLYLISTVRSVTWAKSDKLRAVLIDLAIGLLLPVIAMGLHYIVQGHRFDLLEEVGCLPTSSATWVTFVVFYLPPFILVLISMSYSVRCLLQLRRRQKELSAVLSSNATITKTRFYRLMALASLEMFTNFPIQLYMITTAKGLLLPWVSWEETHSNFGRIVQLPAAVWKAEPAPSVELFRWLPVVSALVFFVCFGFAEEARKHYKSTISSITKRVGISSVDTFTPDHKFGSVTSSVGQFRVSSTDKAAKGSKSSEPVVVSKEVFEKRNSTISFTSVGDTEVGTLRTVSRSNTPAKNSLVDRLSSPTSPTSPSFRLSVPSAAGDHESFLEFSNADREIPPGSVHRV